MCDKSQRMFQGNVLLIPFLFVMRIRSSRERILFPLGIAMMPFVKEVRGNTVSGYLFSVGGHHDIGWYN